MNRYEILERLGDGSFGEVSKARSLKTNELVAIKKMKVTFPTWEECLQLRELKSLRVLRHENVVQLKEVIRDKEELYFVFEYMQSSLHKLLRHHQHQTHHRHNGPSSSGDDAPPASTTTGMPAEAQIKSIMYQLFAGLAYMHKHGFFHRDIKPENLLCHDETLKIADLGQAREIRARPPFTDYVSTRWYRSPELLLRATSYNSPIDLWACGCIMAELFLQAPLFAGSSEADQLCRIAKVLGSPTKDNWPEAVTTVAQMQFKFPKCAPVAWHHVLPSYTSKAAVQLISELLQYDPSRRLTAAQALQHRYFDQQVPRPVSLTPALSVAAVAPSPSMLSLPLKAEQKGWSDAPATSRWWRESASTLPSAASHGDVLLASSRKHFEGDAGRAMAPPPPRADAKTSMAAPSHAERHGSSKPQQENSAASWLSARKWTSPEMDDEEPTTTTTADDKSLRADDEKKQAERERGGEKKQSQHQQQRRRNSGTPSFRSQDHMLQDLLDEFLA